MSATVVLDTYFLGQVEDESRWEERFDLLVNEVREEYGPNFAWLGGSSGVQVDILFVLYPPGRHHRVIEDKLLEEYVYSRTERVEHVYVIVIGRNSRSVKVSIAEVIEVVDNQCIPRGLRGSAHRALRPEDMDDVVRAILIRIHSRRLGAIPQTRDDSALASDQSVIAISHPLTLPYESSDL